MRRLNIPDVNTPSNYDEIYLGWRTVQLMPSRESFALLESLNKNKGNVLDVGCGVGRYFPAFKGSKIYGTEISPKARTRAIEVTPEAKVVEWFAGDKLPFDNNFFQLVWAGEFLEHIKDPQQAIDEIYRVLAPNGVALFVTPVGRNSECMEHLWFFDRKDIDGFFSKYKNKEIELTQNETRFKIILRK